jgi:hypothetical protein
VPNAPIHCHFCKKLQKEVRKLIAGPDVYICDDCVGICNDILAEDSQLELAAAGHSGTQPAAETQKVDLEALGFNPPFRTVRFEIRKNHVFHLCPFSEPFDTIYRDHVAGAAKTAGFSIERADEIFGSGPVIEDIWQAIVSATAITADVTGRNPNVMYEIGMAHTVGKPVVMLAQNIEDVPFDLRHHRSLIYTYTPRGCADLEAKLCGTLRFIKGRIGQAD